MTEALGRGVPFGDTKIAVEQDDRPGRSFEQAVIPGVGPAEFSLGVAALAKNQPRGPGGQQERRGNAAADVEVMEADVVEVAEVVILDEFPERENDSDDADAGQDQRAPEPSLLAVGVRHARGTHEGRCKMK